MNVRAKFKCDGVTPRPDGDGGDVSLSAVTSGSTENESFFRWTPTASLRMGTVNQAAFQQFEAGKEYYVDISPAG